jgi:hypothetical protein
MDPTTQEHIESPDAALAQEETAEEEYSTLSLVIVTPTKDEIKIVVRQ